MDELLEWIRSHAKDIQKINSAIRGGLTQNPLNELEKRATAAGVAQGDFLMDLAHKAADRTPGPTAVQLMLSRKPEDQKKLQNGLLDAIKLSVILGNRGLGTTAEAEPIAAVRRAAATDNFLEGSAVDHVVYRGDRPNKTTFTGKEDPSNYIQGNVFFSSDPKIAKFYIRNPKHNYRTDYMADPAKLGEAEGLYRAHLSLKNPLVVDAKGAKWSEIPTPKELRRKHGPALQIDDMAAAARKRGYDGLIVRDVWDQAGGGDQFVAFEPHQIRRVDQNGNPIASAAQEGSLSQAMGRARDRMDARVLPPRGPYLERSLDRMSDPLSEQEAADVFAKGRTTKFPYEDWAAKHAPEPAPDWTEKHGIEAWHGSPYSFDKFDASKIGTGEGAQSYGRGLYFAENPEVAKTYKEGLSLRRIKVGDETYTPSRTMADRHDPRAIAHGYLTAGIDAQSSDPFGWARRFVRSNEDAPYAKDVLKVLDDWQERGATVEGGGHLYHVNLDVDPEQLLDWDAPIKDQPRALAALRGMGYTDAPWPYTDKMMHPDGGTFIDLNAPGEEAYRSLAILRGRSHGQTSRIAGTGGSSGPLHVDPASASSALSGAGIPGVKYFDGLSRGSGKGTRNYVIFDPNRVKILEALGVAGLLGGGAAAQRSDDQSLWGQLP